MNDRPSVEPDPPPADRVNMDAPGAEPLIALATDQPIWDRFFTVAPLVLVGSRGPDGVHDLAPKHLALPLGWDNYFGFVCTPRHATYHNVRARRQFTVSFPRPSQVLLASLAAAPRCDDGSKPGLLALPTFPASRVDGVLVRDCYLYLECDLHQVVDGFGANSLIVGKVVAAAAREDALRRQDQDESDQLYHAPLLAYLSPGRLAEVRQTTAFPFPKDFTR
jgi:flavin reductase (DIM6/NTAB) family NADH-FMN oxidoreductase RutF